MFISHFLCSILLRSWNCKNLLVFVWIFPMEFLRQKVLLQASKLNFEVESLWETVLMSYSEKSPGYLAQMQNWPSVWPKNSWGAGDGQPATNFFVPSLRYFGLWLRGDQRVQQHVTFSYSSKSKQKIWTTKFISSQKNFRRVFRRFSKENFTEKSLGTLLQDEVLNQFW